MPEKLDSAACVRRGAELLDRVRPKWAEVIDLERLDMWSCNWCILGQVFGSYDKVIENPEEYFPGVFNRNVGVVAFGFNAEFDCCEADHYYALADLWEDEIERRRNGTDHRGV